LEYLALYSQKCKSCGHLDPEEERKYNKCHFSKGNNECPAAEVRIAVVGEAKRLADALKRARARHDMEKEIEILSRVAKRSAAFQQKFREHTTSP
jgi:superfamily I DNA/RNA helicase